MADRIHRITMFKAPRTEDQEKLFELYEVLRATNQKDGKAYIASLVVGLADDDNRSQGYTVVCKTEFYSMEDMKYYEDQCQAHKSLKSAVTTTMAVEGMLTVYFKPRLVSSLAP